MKVTLEFPSVARTLHGPSRMKASELLARKPWLVAEMGANHCGEVRKAEAIADMCCASGVDAVKGQMRDVFGSPHRYGMGRPYDGPNSFGATYLAHRQFLELGISVHRDLRARCESRGVSYSVSVWDRPSAEAWLAEGPEWVKVPSACMSDEDVLAPLREWGGTVIISTGMHTAAEIRSVVESFDRDRLVVLHCTSTYPCRAEDVHLAEMDRMRGYGAPHIGVSGHWPGASAIDVQAATLGAEVIERHVTMDRTWKGTDHAASLEPEGVRRWVRDVRQVPVAYGRSGVREYGCLPCEESARRKLMGVP